MSKIPFKFRPIPDEFLIDEFIDDPIMMRFIRWMMRKISSDPQKVFINGRNIQLMPFEFIFGREACSEQAGISPKQARGRLGQLIGQHFIQKVASKSASTFTVYSLVAESFSKNDGQQKGQQKGQHLGQHLGHNQDLKDLRSKKDLHHPNPSSSKVVALDDEDLMDEDFFLPEENAVKDPKTKHNRNYRTSKNQSLRDKKTEELFEIYPDICISLEILTECKNTLEQQGIKGTIENIKFGVNHIMTAEGRKWPITDWPKALKKWKITYPTSNNYQENEEYAKALESLNSNGCGWCCEVSIEPKKNQKGLYFYNTGQGGASVFLTTEDSNFIKKADDILKAKNMKTPKQKKQGIA